MSTPLNKSEIVLDSKRYRILGNVREQLVNPFPGKVVEGDVSRDDEQVLSSWVMTSFSGGLGIVNGSFPSDQDRFNFATLETRYPRQLSLAPLVTQRSTTGPAQLMFEYNGVFYVVIDKVVKSWSEDTQTLTTEHTLADDPTGVEIYLGTLYIAVGDNSDLETFDGTSWSTVSSQAGKCLLVWNDSLYLLTNDGALSRLAGGTWTPNVATLDLPSGSAKQMLVYFDSQLNAIPHVVTDRGVYAFDLDAQAFFPTPMTYPIHPKVGTAIVWRGDLYVPVGATVYKYNTQTIQVVGPDKDEGLPSDYRGYVKQLVGTHPFYYAIIDASFSSGTTALNLLYTGSHRNTTFFSKTASRALILSSPESSWHGVWEEEQTGKTVGYAAVSQADSTYRFWWSSTTGLYSLDLPTGLHNPLQNPAQAFQNSGYLITPWFDANWAEIDKLALRCKLVGENITSDESYTLSAQWDEGSDWDFIGNGTASGRTVFNIEKPNGGKIFRRIRFKLEMKRGSTATKTPVLHSIALSFDRVPPPIWGYQVTLDLTEDFGGRSVREQWRDLYAAILKKRAIRFQYRHRLAGEQDLLVRFTREQGGFNADDEKGQAIISLIELESRDEDD